MGRIISTFKLSTTGLEPVTYKYYIIFQMREMLKLLALCLLPQLAISSIIRTGSCDENVRGISGFDKSSYLGQWYEYSNVFEWYQDLPFVGRCVRATYTDEGEIGVLNEFVMNVTGYGNIKGNARFANPDDPEVRAELIVGFGPFQTDHANYNVIETDYTTYSVVYTCSPFLKIFRQESLWLLTREQVPTEETVQQGYKVMRDNGLPLDHLVKTRQEDCADLPQ